MFVVFQLDDLVLLCVHLLPFVSCDNPIFVQMVLIAMGRYAVFKLPVEEYLGRAQVDVWEGGVPVLQKCLEHFVIVERSIARNVVCQNALHRFHDSFCTTIVLCVSNGRKT